MHSNSPCFSRRVALLAGLLVSTMLSSGSTAFGQRGMPGSVDAPTVAPGTAPIKTPAAAEPPAPVAQPQAVMMRGMHGSSEEVALEAARPFVEPDTKQEVSAATKDGAHQGVTMHGHWVIDVKNPDGTLAEHRDFENTATGYGQELIVGLLSGYVVPSDYGVFLSTNGTAPCAEPQGFAGCLLVRSLTTLPATAACPYYSCFTGLTYTPTLIDTSATGSSFMLAGSFTASQAGTITGVNTLYGTCPANLSAVSGYATVTPATCSTTAGSGGYRTVSSASITTVNVVASQIVQVTVTFTFS